MNLSTETASAEALASVVASIMNGEQLPEPGTAAFGVFEQHVRQLLQASAHEREHFGVRVLGHLIDASRAHIKATQTLRSLGSGEEPR